MTYYYYLDCCLALFGASTDCSKVPIPLHSRFMIIFGKTNDKKSSKVLGWVREKENLQFNIKIKPGVCTNQTRNNSCNGCYLASQEFVRIRRGNNSYNGCYLAQYRKIKTMNLVKINLMLRVLSTVYVVLDLCVVLVLVFSGNW